MKARALIATKKTTVLISSVKDSSEFGVEPLYSNVRDGERDSAAREYL